MSPTVLHLPASASSPVTVNTQVTASGDDCYARESGSFSNTSVSNWVGHASPTAYNYRALMRFQLNVPQGATIDSAFMEQYANGQLDGGGTHPLATTIQAEDVDNATQVVDYADFTSREPSLTTASVAWNVATASSEWAVGAWYTTPDLKSIIQEIVNRPGWVSGNYINIWWGPTDPTYTAAQDIVVQGTAYDDAPAEAAKLEVTYLS